MRRPHYLSPAATESPARVGAPVSGTSGGRSLRGRSGRRCRARAGIPRPVVTAGSLQASSLLARAGRACICGGKNTVAQVPFIVNRHECQRRRHVPVALRAHDASPSRRAPGDAEGASPTEDRPVFAAPAPRGEEGVTLGDTPRDGSARHCQKDQPCTVEGTSKLRGHVLRTAPGVLAPTPSSGASRSSLGWCMPLVRGVRTTYGWRGRGHLTAARGGEPAPLCRVVDQAASGVTRRRYTVHDST